MSGNRQPEHDSGFPENRFPLKEVVTYCLIFAPVVYFGIWAIMYYEYPRVRMETHALVGRAVSGLHAYAK